MVWGIMLEQKNEDVHPLDGQMKAETIMCQSVYRQPHMIHMREHT